ncbi:hypothetical protein GGTG_06422 [Gaeumannomyces tritici R3-111a-1]|uniref:Uncharacterized protein n=1 Tax=Gaeumannomyces tritici (strain R3-111a-1) TaxID=644352 RepID=J3NYS0_GAET3|nr:hypothetical protein GGTG_06422 [Gaeumannomyces tritici R3-111a-1]EJT76503.1 hypothetical protein GGTG_06422 [Gaeumannomyces tritici R3-111a-1]
MAMIETVSQDRHSRRRPFATLVKKLRNFKGGYSGDDSRTGSKHTKSSSKQRASKNNNPYPESGRIGNGAADVQQQHLQGGSTRSFSTSPSGVTSSATSLGRTLSLRSSTNSTRGRAPTAGARSTAPTVSTDHEAAHSIAAPSHGASSVTGTSRTANGGLESRRGGDSTFSSPAPSVRSMTTTLTTIQSLPLGGHPYQPHQGNGGSYHHHHSHHQASSSQVIHFNQPFPSTPASAIPPHLNPSGGAAGATMLGQQSPQHTYTTATANGLLTDNASILTLASSSKGRRRRSLDTNASVRALAPSSVFGGSRESLPLSVLSATIDPVPAVPTTPGAVPSSRMVAERASIYSTSGIIPGDRSSFYASKQQKELQDKASAAANGAGPSSGGGAPSVAEAASIRNGLLGHSRADSINGNSGAISSALASPREDPGGEDVESNKTTQEEIAKD